MLGISLVGAHTAVCQERPYGVVNLVYVKFLFFYFQLTILLHILGDRILLNSCHRSP
jgi:hypothetical protein